MRQITLFLVSIFVATGLTAMGPGPVAAAVNTIYVGSEDDSTPASSCADPDYSTDVSDEGSINSALESALTAIDVNGDIVIICSGTYTFTGDVEAEVPYTTAIRAESDGTVTLDGDDANRILAIDLGDPVDENQLTISGITFQHGYGAFGGAIYFEDGILALSDTTFEENFSENEGGAIYAEGSVLIDRGTFTGNRSLDDGGALYLTEGNLQLTDSEFTDNVSDEEGGGIYLDECLEVLIDGNDFTGNEAGNSGGGAINFDCSDTTTEAQIVGNAFTANIAEDYGGAVDEDDNKVLVYTRNLFLRNHAVGSGADGGAVWIGGGRFYRNRFVQNRADGLGGGVYVSGRSDGGTVPRNRFSGNRASRGPQYYYSR